MGNCTVIRGKHSYPQPTNASVSSIDFISRSSKSLMKVIPPNVVLVSLKKNLRVFYDSCISFLDDSNVIIAGGSDSTSTLTNRVYLINRTQNSISELRSLPIPVKYGSFMQISNYLYYACGTCDAESADSAYQEEASPIMRLDLDTYSWEVFKDSSTIDKRALIKRKVTSTDQDYVYKAEGIKLKSLIDSSCTAFDGRIYFFGGRVQKTRGIKPVDWIICVRINEGEFEVREENVRLPVKIFAASACIRKGIACVAGGHLEDLSENLDVFIVDIPMGTARKIKQSVDRPLEPRYPISVNRKGIWCFSGQSLINIKEDNQEVYYFDLPPEEQLLHEEIQGFTKVDYSSKKPQTLLVDLEIKPPHPQKPSTTGVYQADLYNNEPMVKHSDEHPIKIKDPGAKHADQNNAILFKEHNEGKAAKRFCDFKHEMKNTSSLQSIPCSCCSEIISNYWHCSTCSKIFCDSCSTYLLSYRRLLDSKIKCKNGHCFSAPSSNLPGCANIKCSNCKLPHLTTYLYCFLCKKHLCKSCSESISTLISSSYICQSAHPLKWAFKIKTNSASSQICDVCIKKISGLGYFSCSICCTFTCQCCINYSEFPDSYGFIQSIARRNSLNYNKRSLEVSFDDFNEEKVFTRKEKRTNTSLSAIQTPLVNPDGKSIQYVNENTIASRKSFGGSEASWKSERKAVLLGSEREFRKLVPQKPVRGVAPEFILNLSPKKNNSEVSSVNGDLPEKRSITPMIENNSITPIIERLSPCSSDSSSSFLKRSAVPKNDIFTLAVDDNRDNLGVSIQSNGNSRNSWTAPQISPRPLQKSPNDSDSASEESAYSFLEEPNENYGRGPQVLEDCLPSNRDCEGEFEEGSEKHKDLAETIIEAKKNSYLDREEQSQELVVENEIEYQPEILRSSEEKRSESISHESFEFDEIEDVSENQIAPRIENLMAASMLKALKEKLNLPPEFTIMHSSSDESLSD